MKLCAINSKELSSRSMSFLDALVRQWRHAEKASCPCAPYMDEGKLSSEILTHDPVHANVHAAREVEGKPVGRGRGCGESAVPYCRVFRRATWLSSQNHIGHESVSSYDCDHGSDCPGVRWLILAFFPC